MRLCVVCVCVKGVVPPCRLLARRLSRPVPVGDCNLGSGGCVLVKVGGVPHRCSRSTHRLYRSVLAWFAMGVGLGACVALHECGCILYVVFFVIMLHRSGSY